MASNSNIIPFNRPYVAVDQIKPLELFLTCLGERQSNYFKSQCEALLRELNVIGGSQAVFFTPSGTAALEMAMLLLDLAPGDEVIVPSYTFVTSASCAVLRGATPVFVDVDLGSANIMAESIAEAITEKTRAVVVVHYAGVASDLDQISSLCNLHGIDLIEDAAQAIGSKWDGRSLGSFGRFSAFSFHHTKNVHCGEGGCLIVNRESDLERAHVIYEKGTNRTEFFKGEVDKYLWKDIGSSFELSELAAAFLMAQLSDYERNIEARQLNWEYYRSALGHLDGVFPQILNFRSETNGHFYFLRLTDPLRRPGVIEKAREFGVSFSTHYQPLHSTGPGKLFGRLGQPCTNTDTVASSILRLPCWPDVDAEKVAKTLIQVLKA